MLNHHRMIKSPQFLKVTIKNLVTMKMLGHHENAKSPQVTCLGLWFFLAILVHFFENRHTAEFLIKTSVNLINNINKKYKK